MFEDVKKMLFSKSVHEDLWSIVDRMKDVSVPRIGFSVFYEDKKNTNTVPVSKIGEMVSISRDCIEGVKEIDSLIYDLKHMRGELVSNVLSIRHFFPTYNPDNTRNLVEAVKSTSVPEMRQALANFLGYDKLPDEIVNVGLSLNSRMVIATFGVKGKPTRMGIGAPIDVDLCNDQDVRYMYDKDMLDYYDVKSLEKEVPLLKFFISLGSGDGDERVAMVSSIEDLRNAIEKAMECDVRDDLDKIEDISDVKDADQFQTWRMLRRANANAAKNSGQDEQ